MHGHLNVKPSILLQIYTNAFIFQIKKKIWCINNTEKS